MHTSQIVYLGSAALVGYVVVGYPVLLSAMARWFRAPVYSRPEIKPVSVVIAVRNGAPWIRRKLESILAADYPQESVEILVVSDGSDDGTDDIVREFGDRRVCLFRVPQGGKPAALTAAFPLTRNELLLLTDVRQEIEPESLARLVACFADPKVGVVSGDLSIRGGETSAESSVSLYWRYETWIRKRLSDVDSMLGATGPFYMIRRDLVIPIPPDTLLDDVYLPLAAFFRGYRLVMEESARAIDYPTTLETEFRRKVRTLAGNYQIMHLYPALFGPKNRMWFHYMSYKVGRLLLPFGLVAMGISSFWMPSPWWAWAIGSQVAFYLLALADLLVPESSTLKRISSPVRTFVVLMIAAVVALKILYVSPRSLWSPTRTGAIGPDAHPTREERGN
jgi:biofilm PGA synthesis N-glycosyltransferase PgaC